MAWLVCKRQKIEPPSQQYLAEYLNANQEIPPVDILAIAKAVEKIEALYHSLTIEKGLIYKHNSSIRESVRTIEGKTS